MNVTTILTLPPESQIRATLTDRIEDFLGKLINRITKSYWDYLCRNYTASSLHNRSVVLVLIPETDTNGATRIPKLFFNTFRLNRNKKVAVVYQRISNIGDLEKVTSTLKSQNNRIRSLWVNSHGSPSSFSPSDEYRVPLFDLNGEHSTRFNRLCSVLNNALDPDATIIMECCSTGAEIETETTHRKIPGFSMHLAHKVTGRVVYAAPNTINYYMFHPKMIGDQMVAKFTKPHSRNGSKMHKVFFNGVSIVLFCCTLGNYGVTTTRRFQVAKDCASVAA